MVCLICKYCRYYFFLAYDKPKVIINYIPATLTPLEFSLLLKPHRGIQKYNLAMSKTCFSSFCNFLLFYLYLFFFSKAKNLNLGYGFVDFNTKEDAISFIDKINGMILLEKKLKVSWARGFFFSRYGDFISNLFLESRQILSNANVFVSYLPADVSEKEFKELFQKFGEIISCKLLDGGFFFGILISCFD
jgi:hypothetical protein